MTAIPTISREDQLKQVNKLIVGQRLVTVKDEKDLIVLEFDGGDLLVFVKPQAIALGVKQGEKK